MKFNVYEFSTGYHLGTVERESVTLHTEMLAGDALTESEIQEMARLSSEDPTREGADEVTAETTIQFAS